MQLVVKYIMSEYSKRLLWFMAVLSFVSCKKLVDVNPPTNSTNSENVFNNDATAIAAITNIYVDMSKADLAGGGITSMSLFPGLSVDELSLYNGATGNAVQFYYQNSLTSNNVSNPDFWSSFYKEISAANTAIQGVTNSNRLSSHVKQQIMGEALFVRAFCYFYLVNLYGDVPLILTTDYKVNSSVSRTSKTKVYDQVIADLKDAEGLLNANFVDATLLNTSTNRVRPTTWAAKALLARVYLYQQQWADAESEASGIISNTSLFDTVSLANAFLKNNKAAIWQLQPVNAGWNTEDARIFLLPSSGPDQTGHPFFLSNQQISSFEPGDQRKTVWVGKVTQNSKDYYYPTKYKSANYNDPLTEYQTVFRIAEQYLIRAEARANGAGTGLNGAVADLNKIRAKAGITAYSGPVDKDAILNAILHERQIELFTEWGHRWLDLKRTGKIDAVMNVVTPQKGGSWNSNWQWYPISKSELLLNPKLEQNAGY